MSIFEKFIGLYTATSCLVCGASAPDICEGCAESLFISALPTCYLCNAYTKTYKTCSTCLRKGGPGYTWACYEYKHQVKELVKKYKYQKIRTVAKPMAKYIAEVVPGIAEFDFVTFVPTATTRVRQRGFDHAGLLALNVAKYLRKPCVQLLVKTNQHRQVGSSRTQRQKAMEDSFRVRHRGLIKGSSLLIIDDVVSTGSTLTACAKTLKQNGAKRVDAAVFARNI